MHVLMFCQKHHIVSNYKCIANRNLLSSLF